MHFCPELWAVEKSFLGQGMRLRRGDSHRLAAGMEEEDLLDHGERLEAGLAAGRLLSIQICPDCPRD